MTNAYFPSVSFSWDIYPPILYVQMDNCWRENKNKYVITFLCLLVENGIFEKVGQVSFPVGASQCFFNS